MKNILTSFLLIALFSNIPVEAQKPASIVYLRAGVNLNFSWPEHGKTFLFPAFNLTPGLRILQGRDFAMVMTLPISVGISSDDYAHNSFFGIDTYSMLEFDFGSSAGNSPTGGIGFMAGIGLGYQAVGKYYDSNADPGYQDSDMDFWGYRLSFGISLGRDSTGDRTLISFNFGKSLTPDKKYTASIGIYLILGNRKKLSDR